MQHTLHSMAIFDMSVDGYTDWLSGQDLSNAFADLRDLLKVIQWQNGSVGRPWMLKNVFHIHDLATLRTTFPDAKVVWVHRHPRENLPSWCSLVHTLRRPLSAAEDARQTGRQQLAYWARATERGIRQRVGLGENGFVDLHYGELLGNSRRTLDRVLTFFGEESSALTLDRLLEWEADNPQHKHGRHVYSAEQYGLADGEIDTAFGQYIAHFGLSA